MEVTLYGNSRYYFEYPTNIASVNLVMGCFKVFFPTILTPALAY